MDSTPTDLCTSRTTLSIPTVFERDPHSGAITKAVNPECEWVLAGVGVPRAMHYGVHMQFDGQMWWLHHSLRDMNHLAKFPAWQPATQSRYAAQLAAALKTADEEWSPGVGYELCGPGVLPDGSNPERLAGPKLFRHDTAQKVYDPPLQSDFEFIQSITMFAYETYGWRGIVWYDHDDGRVAKVKAVDFLNA